MLWTKIEELRPQWREHKRGSHDLSILDQTAIDVIFFLLRIRCQLNALRKAGICSFSSAHRRFQEQA